MESGEPTICGTFGLAWILQGGSSWHGIFYARMMPSVIILCWHEYCMGRVGIYIAMQE